MRRSPRSLADLLRRAAEIAPSSGVIDEHGMLVPWGEVDRQCSLAASHLVATGTSPGDRVVVIHPKSLTSFVAMHAAMRAGAIAVPVDPRGAKAQVASIVASTSPSAIVTTSSLLGAHANSLSGTSAHVITSDAGAPPNWIDIVSETRAVTAHPELEPTQPAYIIFTSGSTGTPKGIVHTHQSALAYAERAAEVHKLDPSCIVAGTSPLHFDMSTLELYAVPLAGSTALTVSEQQLMFPATLTEHLAAHRATHLYAVPYQLRQLVNRGDVAHRDLSAVRQISFGGEQFATASLEAVRGLAPGAELLNVYGPAEVNGVISQRWEPDTAAVESVPIGSPWPDVAVRIVDETGETEVAPGDSGELLVSSPSAMQGYWAAPELTNQSFADEQRRWYRTGDRVRSIDGVLHFLGRIDNRIKVRGVRIELEEIESALGDAPGVEHAVAGVVRQADGNEFIRAWVVGDPQGPPPLTALKQHCRSRLPAAGVPSDIVLVDEFPQTQSGKIDRRAVRRDNPSGPRAAAIAAEESL